MASTQILQINSYGTRCILESLFLFNTHGCLNLRYDFSTLFTIDSDSFSVQTLR